MEFDIPKGKPRGRNGGRKAGVPNKINAQLKDMILGALSDVGGQKYLAEQARAEPKAFLALLGRVLPMQVASDPNAPFQIQIVKFCAENADASE